MPAGSLTNAQVGIPIPLSYGFNRVTGNQLGFITNPPSTSSPPYPPPSGSYPLMQVGLWAGGEGEWDGPDGLFIAGNRMLAYSSNGEYIGPDPTTGTIPPGAGSAYTSPLVGVLNWFTFHPGVDASLAGAADNAKQGLDPLWNWFNGLVTALRYSRLAYWGIAWTPQIGTSPGDMTPELDMRCMKCRIFDGDGNQIGYRFTTNPIWHLVDVYLRRAIKPQYTIDPATGPTPLTTYEQDCFRWDIIAASAAYCDATLANGRPRFSGSYAFAAGTTLGAISEQMLLVCRGYKQEIAGKLAFFIDQPRSSVFTVTGSMLMPGTFDADDTLLHPNPNRYIGSFLEIDLPAIATIATITRASGVVQITTVNPNPCAAEDFIVLGGVADDSFDGGYMVSSVSDSGVITAAGSGADASSTGGSIGYLESRFAQRTPEAPAHIQHQLAVGQVLPPNAGGQRLKRVKVDYNYANCSWDQAMRLLLYEQYHDLGADASPYKPPQRISLTLWADAVDAAGNVLWDQAMNGNVITLDPTAFYEFAGEWEIIEVMPHPFQVDPQMQGGTYITQPSANSGTIQLVLWSFDPARFIDDAGVPTPSFATVPSSFLYGGSGGVSWTLTGGTISLVAASGPPSGPYEVTITWTGVTATAPDGALLSYTDGGAAVQSNQFPVVVAIFDPTSSGGNCVSVYPTGSVPPAGANSISTIASPPALGGTASYSI